jgi:CBS domain-containing protein
VVGRNGTRNLTSVRAGAIAHGRKAVPQRVLPDRNRSSRAAARAASVDIRSSAAAQVSAESPRGSPRRRRPRANRRVVTSANVNEQEPSMSIPGAALAHVHVHDVMNTGILSTDPRTSLRVVARVMGEQRVHVVAVADPGNAGRPWGMVTTARRRSSRGAGDRPERRRGSSGHGDRDDLVSRATRLRRADYGQASAHAPDGHRSRDWASDRGPVVPGRRRDLWQLNDCPRRQATKDRSRWHRAVPDRAHVHGPRSPGQDARDDHG